MRMPHEVGECGKPDSGGSQHLPGMLVYILLLSVFARSLSAFYQGDRIRELPGVHDQISYHTLASRVLAGHGFTFPADWWPITRAGEPTAHWSYLYTLYLVVAYFFFGPHPLAPRVIQALIAGILHPWLSWRIGCRIFGREVGLASALISTVYAYFVFYSGSLMTETFHILAILWTLDVILTMASRGGEDRKRRDGNLWLILGLALGTAILLRQVLLFVAPFLLGWLWWALRAQTVRRRLHGLMSATIVIAAFILPWTVRNYFAFGRFVLLNSNAGFAFFWANHPIHGSDFIPILPAGGPSYAELVPPHLRSLNEAALDRALLAEGLRFVVENPKRYLLLSISRMKEYFKFWPSSESSTASNISRVFSYGFFLPLAILGIGLNLMKRWKRPDARPLLERGSGLLYLFAVSYTMIHLMSWSLIRYRLPVDAVTTSFAALGLCSLGRWVLPSANTWWARVSRSGFNPGT